MCQETIASQRSRKDKPIWFLIKKLVLLDLVFLIAVPFLQFSQFLMCQEREEIHPEVLPADIPLTTYLPFHCSFYFQTIFLELCTIYDIGI